MNTSTPETPSYVGFNHKGSSLMGCPLTFLTIMEKVINNFITATEIEIRYKSKVKATERPRVTASSDAAEILRPIFNDLVEHREAMFALYLNRANKVLGYFLIGLGGISGVVADPKLIFQGALKLNASGIILAHNHPSGNKTPGQADIDLTKKVKAGGAYLEVTLLDHLIILPDDSYFSLADEGLL